MGADDAFRDRATLPAHPQPRDEADTVKGGGSTTDGPTPTPTRPIGPFDGPRDRFESRDELGRGGMGVVVEAFDRALKRPVAIKQMQSASDVDLRRFEREAEITALLEHPGIVPIHDAGRSADGLPYYVMRRIDGDPLDQVVAKKPYAERIAKMPNLLSACDAVGFAHARGVIHRDIKPSNILIGPFGETLVIDWGLARMLDERIEPESMRNSDALLTRVGSVAGTPGFMAPEQARGETLDARADVYALGATMFYVLADAVAITASGATEMVNFVGEGRAPEWDKLPEETPPELRAIIEKAMAPRRDDRYRDASELAADLRRYIAGQFVRAYRYGLAEQIRVFVRRYRAAVAVGLIALAVILLGAVISIRRILDERDEARRARTIAETNQREAAKTRDQLLIQHALHLVEKEPAASIAALRRLGPDSLEWGRAAAVAGAAAAYGIPFGFSVPDIKEGGSLAVSPDSRWAVVMRNGARQLHIVDLDRRVHSRIAIREDALDVDWIDADTLVITASRSFEILDRSRGPLRTIELPGENATVVQAGSGRVWLAVEKNYYLVDAKTVALGAPVIANALEVRPLEDGRAVVAYKDRVELWSPTAPPQRIADGQAERIAISPTRIATRIGPDLCVWNISGPGVQREMCETFTTYETPAAFVDDQVVVDGVNGVIGLSSRGRTVFVDGGRLVFPQRRGMLFFTPNGELHIFDSQGAFSFSCGTTRMHRVAQSPDERFIVSLATTGDVLVWELPHFRPRTHVSPSRRNVFDLTERSIWLIDNADGVYRLDRKTGQEELVATGTGYIRAAVSDDETWLVVGRMAAGVHRGKQIDVQNRLVNLRSRIEIDGADGESFAFSQNFALQIDRRGELLSIGPGGERERVGTFTGPLELVSVHRQWMLGVTPSDVCRYRHDTHAVDCIARPAKVTTIAIDAQGSGWLVSDGALWRWPTGTPELTRYWPSLTITHLTWAGDKLVAAGTGVLVKLFDPVALPISVPPLLSYMTGGPNTIYGVTPRQTIAAIDVPTGVTAELPLRAGAMLTASMASMDGAIALASTSGRSSSRDVLLYVPGTPREPAALREWLATVTNALPIPGSDAVAWP